MSSSNTFQNHTGKNVPEQELATANQAAADSGSFDDITNANNAAAAGTAESAAEGAGEGEMAGPDNEPGLEEESGEADKETGADKAGDKQTKKGVSGKTSQPRQQKMHWNPEKDRVVLLVGLKDPENLGGDDNTQKLARWFREQPSGKAIQVRITKLRNDADALCREMGIGDDAGATQAAGPVAAAPDPNTSPDVDLSDPVFPSIPSVFWVDLPEDIVKTVKAAVERRKQEMDAEALAQGLVARQQAQIAQQNQAEDDRQDAAEALMTLSAGLAPTASGSGAGDDPLKDAIRSLTGGS